MSLPPTRIRPIAAVAALAALTVVAACGSSTDPAGAAPTSSGAAAVPVVASTDVYGSIVTAIGGDRVAVTSIIDSPDADPHEYESTPADAAAVNRAKLVVLNGGGYDDFATQLVEAAPTRPTVVDVVELSGLRSGDGEFNEHVWYSLPTVKRLADTLAADLAAADPAGAATYTANATAFTARIDGLIGKLGAIKAAHGGEKVAVTEPVPLYVVADAGLVNATPEEFSEASEEGTDPSAAVLDETLTLFTGKQVEALLSNVQTESASTRQVEQAAGTAGVPQVAVTETLPPGVTDYVAWQEKQIDELAAALGPAS